MSEELVWEALEYEYREKTPDWFWGLGAVALLSIIASVLLGNILFAGVILLGAITMAMYGARIPKMERFSIVERGITIGKTLYPFATLESFWVHDEPETKPVLFIKSKKTLMPLISIPITHVNPSDVRERLLDELIEEEHHFSLSERLMHLIGF